MKERTFISKIFILMSLLLIYVFSQTWQEDSLVVHAILDYGDIGTYSFKNCTKAATINGVQRVGELNFLSLVTPTKISSDIGKLTGLKELKINQGRILTLPPEIGNCINLEVLSLVGCALKALPQEIGNCTKLRYLELSSNVLNTIPKELKNCAEINYLDLVHNNIWWFSNTLSEMTNENLDLRVAGNHLDPGELYPKIVDWLDEYAEPNWRGMQTSPVIHNPNQNMFSSNFQILQKNENTTLALKIISSGYISVDMVDVRGRLVTNIVDCYKQPGTHHTTWNMGNYSTGTYFIKLKTNEDRAVRRMVFIK